MKITLIPLLLIFSLSCMQQYESEDTMPKSEKNNLNRLIKEKSPYLLQHAENPVDWYPWGEEAFQKAKKEDKPIFLSIGYSTCHWCHVMAHESFEDEEIAAMLNNTFICIKVDREERPDIDNVYMKVCQMMTGSGGWPLTIVMTPGQKPFFAATYIPPVSRYGRMGMPDLIRAIDNAWKNDRKKITGSVAKIMEALNQENLSPEKDIDPGELATKTNKWLSQRFDEENGGFGSAPKFPSPHNLIFLLRYGYFSHEKKAQEMVFKTLEKMRYGGIYDHIGYGFHRYSTDKIWKLPHFEKMLYDQAMLLFAYTEAYQNLADDDPRKDLFSRTIEEIITYVKRDLTADNGGFYSAEDADSEGKEGKFYVWKTEELKDLLTEEEFDLVVGYFKVSPDGNFAEEPTKEETGDNVFHASEDLLSFAGKRDLDAKLWTSIREKLFQYREKRIHPGKDDKILTDWNGLMLGSIAMAARVFEREDWLDMAKQSSEFLTREMRQNDGGLFHRYRQGEKGISGFIDDYAFVIWGLIELYASTLEVEYLHQAIALIRQADDRFWERENGGYFFSGDQNEKLISETKDLYDGAIPSGNSVMLNNLLSVYHLTGDVTYRTKIDELVRTFGNEVSRQPGAYTQFMTGLLWLDHPAKELVISGESEKIQDYLKQITSNYRPDLFLLWRNNINAEKLSEIAPFTENQISQDGLTFYLCEDHACNLPTNNFDDILGKLKFVTKPD